MNIEEATEMLKRIYVTEFNTSSIYDNVPNVNLAIETLLTAYEEKCKELKKEIQDDLDVRNRWGLTLQELEKEKEKNKILLQCLKDSQERCENEHLFLGNPDM